jgi:hypothetical protein
VYYCGAAHQKADWPSHKTVCRVVIAGPAPSPARAPAPTGPASRCARCLDAFDGKKCRVRHPHTLTTEESRHYVLHTAEFNLSCSACNRSYRKVWADAMLEEYSFAPADAQWCYEGTHCDVVPDGDQRRVRNDEMSLDCDKRLQRAIDALSASHAHLRVLLIGDGMFDESSAAFFLRLRFSTGRARSASSCNLRSTSFLNAMYAAKRAMGAKSGVSLVFAKIHSR